MIPAQSMNVWAFINVIITEESTYSNRGRLFKLKSVLTYFSQNEKWDLWDHSFCVSVYPSHDQFLTS
jgi:hypothetical protein